MADVDLVNPVQFAPPTADDQLRRLLAEQGTVTRDALPALVSGLDEVHGAGAGREAFRRLQADGTITTDRTRRRQTTYRSDAR